MPHGDLLYPPPTDPDLCYLAEYDETLIGDGDPWIITGLDGIGARAATGPRTQRDMAPGEIVGVQVPTAGAVAITMIGTLGGPAAMEEAIVDLCDLWIPADTVRQTPGRLDLLIPGRGHIYVTGHPVQVSPTRVFAGGGVANVVLTFAKSDPTEHTVEPQPS